MINILSLFSGTGSWTKPYENDSSFNIIQLDNNTDMLTNADIQEDILKWDYKEWFLKSGLNKIDVIYASPPCNLYFTNLKHLNGCIRYTEPDKQLSIKLVDRTIEILKYFKPAFWVIENPMAKMRKHYPEILGEKPKVFYYCMWGMRYKKPTDIWTNLKIESPKCPHKRHDFYVSQNKKRNIYDLVEFQKSKKERDRIPERLCTAFSGGIKQELGLW